MKRFIMSFTALFSVACSSGTQYERGAYTPPVRAPTFNPTQDAPHTTGQPGYVNGQRVQRSPNRRYVEPSAEPQMMAADGDARRTVELLLAEDVPSDTPEGIEDAEHATCWKDVRKMMRDNREWILKFSPEEVRCMRHKALAHCGARQIEGRLKWERKDYDSTFEDFMASKGPREKACGKRDRYVTDRVVDMSNKLMTHGDDALGWRP